MLTHLSIRDIVLIKRLDIGFDAGLSVLTGETGAGKSILLDALSLALGARGDSSLVRQGAAEGQVTAVFDVPENHPVRALLDDGFDAGEGGLILKRIQSADGRSRGFINDQPASVATMHKLGRALVEIHGQHDERALVDTDTHRNLLDAWAGVADLTDEVEGQWRAWREAEDECRRFGQKVEESAREAAFLRASVAELEKLAPEPGEEASLADLRAGMMRAEKIAGEINDAHQLLGSADSPVAALSTLLRRLSRKAPDAPEYLERIVQPLDDALVSLDAVQSELQTVVEALEFDPLRLEQAESRLFELRAVARKHNVAVDDLAALKERFTADLADLDAGEDRLAELEAAARAARQAYDDQAERLSRQRHEASKRLAAAVMAELPALKLERAEFFVDVESDPENRAPRGVDTVSFAVKTNPGSRPGPLMKIASGGELSRFLLALKVVLADRGSAPTLVFDEIDTGAGGAVADAIGQRLSRLAENVQVLSVTHAPQVAARAKTHYLITKATEAEDNTVTGVEKIADHSRSEEIARMLAGARITDEARAAARRLLDDTLSKAS